MKYHNWLNLTLLKLKKNIIMDEYNLKLPVELKMENIEMIEYEPEKLSKKVFSFSLFFAYDENMNFNQSYIGGLMFNYRLFLYAKSKLKQFLDYKFRVYIDKKSFLKNKFMMFYLAYLKKLEFELLGKEGVDMVDYNYIEIVLCEFDDDDDNVLVLPTLRFLPVFEGCECHCRDLDFRLSSYDIELIKIFDESEYPLYFSSDITVNPFLAGCWGGNINKRFKIFDRNYFNADILKFYTPDSFTAILLMYKNIYISTFGLDEFILRFYIDMLSDSYLENCLVFDYQYITMMRDYMSEKYVCIAKSPLFAHESLIVFGYNFTTKYHSFLFDAVNPLVISFKFSDTPVDEEKLYIFLETINNGFRGEKHMYDNFFLNVDRICIQKKENEFIPLSKIDIVDKKDLTVKTYDNFISILTILNINLYQLLNFPIEKGNTELLKSYNMKIILHPYLYDKLEKFGFVKGGVMEKYRPPDLDKTIEKYKTLKFTSKKMKDVIDCVFKNETVRIINVPFETEIKSKSKGSLIFKKDLTIKPKASMVVNHIFSNISTFEDKIERLNCSLLFKKNIKMLKFIYFTYSRIVYTYMFNSEDYEEYIKNDDNICFFGEPYTFTLRSKSAKCKFFTIDDLDFFNKNGLKFDPLDVKVGGSKYYYKYLKYKSKYLHLKQNF
jgi:hypothetical protein